MKTPKIYYGALAVFCIAFLTIGTISASPMTQQGTGTHLYYKGGQFVSEKLLSNLTAKGYDVSAISAAVTSGDFATAKTLMKEFRTTRPDEFPAHAKGPEMVPMNGQVQVQRMSQMLNNLTANGFDVSAISAAVTSGDYATAKTLMKEFRTANPDAFSVHGKETCIGHFGGQMRAQNEQQPNETSG